MITRRHTYDEGEITATTTDGYYLWIAYQNATSCQVKKVSVFDPSYIIFDVEISVDKINRMKILGNYLYCAVDDTDYLAVRLYRSNPASNIQYISKPTGVNEEAIDLAIDTTNSKIFYLTPGSDSGENAKVVHYSGLTYSQTTDLSTINNARSIEINDDILWVVTYEAVGKLIKVYEVSGGVYDYEIVFY